MFPRKSSANSNAIAKHFETLGLSLSLVWTLLLEEISLSSLILAIDQGTTSTRAIIYDGVDFQILGVAQQEIKQHYPQDGWVEHEPEEIWYSVARTVREAVARSGRAASEIASIGITNQRETCLFWDRRTSQPYGRAIVWQDRRTADFCRERAADQAWLAGKTGLVLDPYFSATKLRYMLEADCFVLHRLTGGLTHATDAANASRTLLFNIHSLTWDEDLLKYFGVPQAALPTVSPSVSDFGVTKGLDFLPDGVPIRGMAGDQQAALFGQGCLSQGESKCTYGTGAFLLLHTGEIAVTSLWRR
jgi:glycerol kinase